MLSEVLAHKDFTFCGPTGKSAKVLNNRLSAHGRSASTIHSTLKGAGRGDFEVNASEPLEGDVLVMDESGMSDVELADGVLAAANSDMHVIILGDTQQLPSVSPGVFLKDLVSMEGPDHHQLTTTHRNSGGILEVIDQVSRGWIDCVDRPSVKFSHGLGDASTEFSMVAQSYINAVSRHGFDNVILLLPMRKGEAATPGWNTTYANAVLQRLCNPNAEKVPGTRLHVGDRIILRANMSVRFASDADFVKGDDDDDDANATRVVNGDTGSIVSYKTYRKDSKSPNNAGAKSLRLKLDDGRMVDFPGSATELVQLSYALTVHSGQGSEYKHVIFVGTPGHKSFINRPMLFTGLSRARHMLEVFGEDHVVRKIAATPAPKRNSALAPRVAKLLGNDYEEEEEPDSPSTTVSDDDDLPVLSTRRSRVGFGAMRC